MAEGHSHGKDAGQHHGCQRLDSRVWSGHSIHDEPNITFDTPNFDIGLISNEGLRFR